MHRALILAGEVQVDIGHLAATVTKEGLKTKIAKAEEFEKGEALTNVEVYGHLDAYLEHVLGYNWEAVIREQAVEQVNEQIKIYAVAKALKDVAVAELTEKANLVGSQALINVAVKSSIQNYFIVNKVTFTATGTVIEFEE